MNSWPLSYCTLDLSPLFGLPESLHEQVDAAANAGFAYMTPDMFSLRAYHGAGGALDVLAAHVRDAGLQVFDIAGCNVSADPDASREEAFELAGYAKVLGGQWIQARITAPVDDPAVLATYRQCAGIADDVGCGFALEFSPFTPVNGLGRAREVLDRVRVDGRREGIVVDSWHLSYADGLDALRELPATDLAFVQISDVAAPTDTPSDAGIPTVHDTMHNRRLPGEGTLDLGAFADALRHIGFVGVVTVEVLSAELRRLPATDYATRTHDTTRSVLDRRAPEDQP